MVSVAAIVAVTCVALGFWQLQRLEDRRARNAAIEREQSRDPVLITSAGSRGEVEPYSPVRASGRFDPEHEVLVYGRSLNGRSGHWVVTPLVFDDGSAVLVVRGWVPFEYQSAPVEPATPPEGVFTIRGFVLPDEGDGSTLPDEDHVIGRLDIAGIRSWLPHGVGTFAIQLTDQAEPQPRELPIPIGRPELSEGPHLSYAVQWFSFAAIAIVGAVVLLRCVRRERREATAAT
jgi:cytochrome oxidase assembly protein ShyY1